MRTEERLGPARTGAYVIMDLRRERRAGDNEHEDMQRAWVGKVVVAYPADGAGTLYASVWDNTPEAETADLAAGRTSFIGTRGRWGVHAGSAGGYGYDKAGSAVASAIVSAKGFGRLTPSSDAWRDMVNASGGAGIETAWRSLRTEGYLVIQAV